MTASAVTGSRWASPAVTAGSAGVPLAAAARFRWRRPLRWAEGVPARERQFPGQWWSATDGRHIGYESWLERDHPMMLDFDPAVTAVASQPFWLSWAEADQESAPACAGLFRPANGRGGGRGRLHEPRTAQRDQEPGCVRGGPGGERGGGDRNLSGPAGGCDRVLAANVRWLAAYRHPRRRIPGSLPGCWKLPWCRRR